MSDKIVDFVKKYYPYAFKSEIEIKIPTLFTLAQAALETGWGKKAIGNNLFGITADKHWKGKKALVDTFEFHDNPNVKYPAIESITPLEDGNYKYIVKRYFRDYDNVTECFNDHNKVLLKERYKKAFDHTNNPKQFATEIAKGGYATGLNYAETLHKIIDRIERIVETEFLDMPNNTLAEITAKELNVRNAPSIEGEIVQLLRKGQEVSLIRRFDKWYNIKEFEGWVSNDFLDKNNRVTAERLNIREEPMGKKLGVFTEKTLVDIIDRQRYWSFVSGGWWIHGAYIKFKQCK